MVTHGQEKKARVLYVDLQAEGREPITLVWAFETPKLGLNYTHPPTRSQVLISLKQCYSLMTKCSNS